MRIKNDFYQTPLTLTEPLIKFVEKQNLLSPNLSEGNIIFEPCAGDLSLAKVFEQKGYTVVTNDIDKNRLTDYHDDARTLSLIKRRIIYDWAITNPPFTDCSLILKQSISHARKGAIFLLRLSFLEPTNKGNARREILQNYADHLRFVIPVNPRPQFREDKRGTDSVTVSWFIWDKNFSWKKLGVECPFQFFLTDWR